MVAKRRKNRSVLPYRGKLYNMVVQNFAFVPVRDALGKKVKEKGKTKKVRKQELCDAFEIYYNLCVLDELFKSKYEISKKEGSICLSDMTKTFDRSWKYIIRTYARNAPRGMREISVKLGTRIQDVDKTINTILSDVLGMRASFSQGLDNLKQYASSAEYRKIVSWFADFIRQAFATLGMNVVSEEKVNPKFNIKYISFSIGDNMSELISNSSSMLAQELEQVQNLKKLRDSKLKATLLEQGYVIDSQPYYYDEKGSKGVAYITTAYDPQISKFPKPGSKPTPPKFTKSEISLIHNLEEVVDGDRIYAANTKPKAFFVPPKFKHVKDTNGDYQIVWAKGEEQKNEKIIEQIKYALARCEYYAVPRFQEGYGLKPNGEPEAGYYPSGLLKGKPIHKYVIPKSKSDKYATAVRLLNKLLQLRNIHLNTQVYYDSLVQYQKNIKPYLKGVFSSEFTTADGLGYQSFSDINKLAKEIVKKKGQEEALQALKPDVSITPLKVQDYPVWDNKQKKIVYEEKTIQTATFTYPNGTSYSPVVYQDLLNDVRGKIKLGVVKPYFKEIKDGDGSSGVSKTLQFAKVLDSDGVEMEIVVTGRYAGLPLHTIMNMEGKFIEEAYYTEVNGVKTRHTLENRIEIDEEGNVSTVKQTYDESADKWINEQRLIEPYITLNPVNNTLVLGIPGGRTNTADRNLMKDLATKISSITVEKDPRLPKQLASLNPFYYFAPEDFEVIRDTLGSVAMSSAASKFMDKYYESLKAKEAATTVENTERFTPEALGGFVEKTARGKVAFNNKQREAAAWLEASDMRGVIALDTGVGKTLTSIISIKNAINGEMNEGGPERRFLYVSPKNLVGNLKDEVRGFLDEGGQPFKREDGVVETTPNWKQIVLDRIDEMSYEDFVEAFEKNMGVDKKIEVEGGSLTTDVQSLHRSIKYQGKDAVITYEVCLENGKELWRKEVDFQLGTLSTPTTSKMASKEGREIKRIQEQVSYPVLSESELKASKKERTKLRKEVRDLKGKVEARSIPEVNKYFESKYYACFFDEINEIFEKGKKGKEKNFAVSSLSHPRKVFLTASALDRDPIDLYRLSTLAKGQTPSPKSEAAFAEKYGVVLAGRMVGLKEDPEVRTQYYNWVKENSYFSPKSDISYDDMGVDYTEVGLPTLKPLKSTTVTTRMPEDVQRKYRQVADGIKNELNLMLLKYRDLRGQLQNIDETDPRYLDAKGKVYQDLTRATGKVASAMKKLSKLSSEGGFKADVASRIFKDNPSTRVLYFCVNKDLATQTIIKNSKVRPDGVHAICWSNFIHFYRNGKKIAGVKATDNMSLDEFDAKYQDKGLWNKLAAVIEEEDDQAEATWAMDISKKYVKNNASLFTVICSDNYARGFNFQTFTKVVHLDRGTGFDSELLKQRTARAYRGGQAERVEEIYIDATFTPDSTSEGTVSDDASLDTLANASSLSKQELKEGIEYTTWMWDEDTWVKVEDWTFSEENPEAFAGLFTGLGYVLPVQIEGDTHKRIVLLKGKNPKDTLRVPKGLEAISIDQIKSLVNEADQDFFQDIIRNGLKSDLTERLEARISDTGVAVQTPRALLRSMIDPTPENISKLRDDLQEFEDNPLNHMVLDPNRYDDGTEWQINDQKTTALTNEQKNALDLIGGPSALHFTPGVIEIVKSLEGPLRINLQDTKFITHVYRKIDFANKEIKNEVLFLKMCAPRGFASKLLFSEIVQAKKMGMEKITTYAEGSYNKWTSGYAVWPKFGFTASVQPKMLYEKNNPFEKATIYSEIVLEKYGDGSVDLLELLSLTADVEVLTYPKNLYAQYLREVDIWENGGPVPTKPTPKKSIERLNVGEKFWAFYGSTIALSLDLNDQSTSMKVANAYLKRKALEANVNVEDYLNTPSDLFDVNTADCWYDNIDTCVVAGKPVHWSDVVRQYPDAFKSAWYSSTYLQRKVRDLIANPSSYKAFLKKYGLIEMDTLTTPLSVKERGKQKVITEPTNQEYNRLSKQASEEMSDQKMIEESQDPSLQAVWEELRLKNYMGSVTAEILEGDDDPDITIIQNARKSSK